MNGLGQRIGTQSSVCPIRAVVEAKPAGRGNEAETVRRIFKGFVATGSATVSGQALHAGASPRRGGPTLFGSFAPPVSPTISTFAALLLFMPFCVERLFSLRGP